MRTIRRISAFYLMTLFVSGVTPAFAQAPATAATPSSQDNRPKISFDEYLNEVVRHNLDLAIQRSSIAISQAGVTSAKERPDWSADVGFPSADLSHQGFPTTWSAGLNVPIELGGKQKKRVRAATADVATTDSDYQDVVRQARAAAADAFIDSLGSRDILQSKQKSLGNSTGSFM